MNTTYISYKHAKDLVHEHNLHLLQTAFQDHLTGLKNYLLQTAFFVKTHMVDVDTGPQNNLQITLNCGDQNMHSFSLHQGGRGDLLI